MVPELERTGISFVGMDETGQVRPSFLIGSVLGRAASRYLRGDRIQPTASCKHRGRGHRDMGQAQCLQVAVRGATYGARGRGGSVRLTRGGGGGGGSEWR